MSNRTDAPWFREPPLSAAALETDNDQFLTIEKWPQEVFAPHYHEDFNWMVPMRPGRVVVQVEGRELSFDGNQWLCVFPRTAHTVVHVSDDCEIFCLFVPAALMARAYWALEPPPNLEERFILGGRGPVAQGLALEWGEMRLSKRLLDKTDEVFSLFLTGWLWRFYERRCEETASLSLRLRVQLGARGEQAANFFDEHLADSPFPWDDLAAQLDLSRRTLQRQFAEAIGLAPADVLWRLRIERATEQLHDPARSLAEIALACGFASQAHFSTAFKAATSQAPGRYRRMLLADGPVAGKQKSGGLVEEPRTANDYGGAIQARDYTSPACAGAGEPKEPQNETRSLRHSVRQVPR